MSFDQRMYTNFWTEYDDLLNKYNKKHCNQCFLFIDYEIVGFSKITISELFVVETRWA